jgi:hypothetical protein
MEVETDQIWGIYLYKRIECLPQADGLRELENLKTKKLGLTLVNDDSSRRRKSDERKPVVHGTTGQTLMRGSAFVASRAASA